jgi:site-specific recombinase XerD
MTLEAETAVDPPSEDTVVELAPSGPEASADLPGGGGAGLDAVATAAVRAAVAASTAANTKAAYRSDWARFTAWTTARGYPALPAAPEVVAHYLADAAAELRASGKPRYTPATLTRWVSTINQFHTSADHPTPGRSEVVRRTLSGIRRTRATPPKRRTPLLLDDLRTLLQPLDNEYKGWPAAVAARRDTALLLMGFGGAHRRSELVGLTLADVSVHPADGLHVRLRTSKTDQEARGTVRAIPFGKHVTTCAPCAVIRWRQLLDAWDTAEPGNGRRAVMTAIRAQTVDRIVNSAAAAVGGGAERHCCRTTPPPDPGDRSRALFPTVHKTGAIGAGAMSGDAVAAMIQRRATVAGFTPAQVDLLGGHSLRSGFVTEAFRAGADAHAIMRQTGHQDPKMLEVYAREHAPLVGNAVTRLGL